MRFALAACALACGASLAQPAYATERVREEFFGTVAQGVLRPSWDGGPRTRSLEAIARAGLRVVRKGAPWQAAEPRPPVAGHHRYVWRDFDAWIAAMARRGIRWQPVIAYSTTWSGTAGQFSQPRNVDFYAAYARAFAARYGRGGTFWRRHPGLRYLPVRRYEIWNEPNLHGTWRQDASAPRDYFRLYWKARHAIRKHDRRAFVLTGGLGQKAPYLRWLDEMLPDRPERVRRIDAVGLHPYGRAVRDVMSHVGLTRAVLDDHGGRRVPIAVTEVGWSTYVGLFRRGVSDAERGRLLRRLVREVTRSNCHVSEVFVHTWITPERLWWEPEDFFGIANADGTLKPSGRTYTRQARRARTLGIAGRPLYRC